MHRGWDSAPVSKITFSVIFYQTLPGPASLFPVSIKASTSSHILKYVMLHDHDLFLGLSPLDSSSSWTLQYLSTYTIPGTQQGCNKCKQTISITAECSVGCTGLKWSIVGTLYVNTSCIIWITHLFVWITRCGRLEEMGRFFKRWEYWTTWPASWEICMQVKKQQLELDME